MLKEEIVSYINGIPVIKETLEDCPFANLLDMIKYYFDIYISKDINKADCLLDNEFSKYKDTYPKLVNANDMSALITDLIFNSPENLGKNFFIALPNWMDFDENEMNRVLKHPFFDEYHNVINGFFELPRKYFMLELYTYVKVQAFATEFIPENRSVQLWYYLCYQDMIDFIYSSGFHESLAIIYKSYGKEWFCHSKITGIDLDPVLYLYASYANISCRISGLIEIDRLKNDLIDIRDELMLRSCLAGSIEQSKVYLNKIKDIITHYDDIEVKDIKQKLDVLEHENLLLKKDKETLEKTRVMLEKQISSLQFDKHRTDEEKVDSILKRLYSAMPEVISFDESITSLESIWNKLSETTRRDIKTALAVYDLYKTADLASFLLISSIEREFNLNFFAPFKRSRYYKKVKDRFCYNRKFEITHTALNDLNSIPTLGAIPFIGRAVRTKQGIESSEVIKAFGIFLGEKRKEFCCLCDAIQNYQIGLKKYNIIDIRNGVAHGDAKIKEECDEKCFEGVKALLYEPPIQIMFSVIVISMKK